MEPLLEALERATEALRRADPDDFSKLGSLLKQRAAAVAALAAAAVVAPLAPTPEQAERIHRAVESGHAFAERLLVARAGVREQLRQLHGVDHALRALGAAAAEAEQPPLLDIRG